MALHVNFQQNENKPLRFDALNADKKLSTLCSKHDEQKRLVATITNGNIPRQQQSLYQAAHRGCGIQSIIKMLQQACDHKYHPKGFTSDGLDESILLWKLGGHSL
eukprot:14576417-Ditylum_brightwellii.AAC.1